MQAEETRALRNAKPFRAFTVQTSDARKFPIRDALNVGFSYDRKSLCVAVHGGGFACIDPYRATIVKTTPSRRHQR